MLVTFSSKVFLEGGSVGDALLLLDDLPLALDAGKPYSEDKYVRQFWDNELAKLAQQTKALRLELAQNDLRIAIQSWWRMETPIQQILDRFGPQSLFYSVETPLVHWFRFAIGRAIFQWAIDPPAGPDNEYLFQREGWFAGECSRLAGSLLQYEPWKPNLNFPVGLGNPLSHYVRVDVRLHWPSDPNISDAALVCLAIMSEFEPLRSPVLKTTSGILQDLCSFAASPLTPDCRARALVVVEERCASEEVRQVLKKWVIGEYRFTSRLLKKTEFSSYFFFCCPCCRVYLRFSVGVL